jgi:catechol-2,3-dioxygenase
MTEKNNRLILHELDHVALSVSDPAKSAEWYHAVLGLERRHANVWGDYPIMMCAGNSGVALFALRGSAHVKTADANEGLTIRHFAFRTDWKNFTQAKEYLRRHQIPFQPEDHIISQSIYDNDPDGHQIEITTYDLESR